MLFSVYFWAIVVVLFVIALAFFALLSWWRPCRVSRGSIPARVPTPPKGTTAKGGKAPRAHVKPHIAAARVSKSVRTAHGLTGVCTDPSRPSTRAKQATAQGSTHAAVPLVPGSDSDRTHIALRQAETDASSAMLACGIREPAPAMKMSDAFLPLLQDSRDALIPAGSTQDSVAHAVSFGHCVAECYSSLSGTYSSSHRSLGTQLAELAADVARLQTKDQQMTADVARLQAKDQQMTADVARLQAKDQQTTADTTRLAGDVARLQAKDLQTTADATRLKAAVSVLAETNFAIICGEIPAELKDLLRLRLPHDADVYAEMRRLGVSIDDVRALSDYRGGNSHPYIAHVPAHDLARFLKSCSGDNATFHRRLSILAALMAERRHHREFLKSAPPPPRAGQKIVSPGSALLNVASTLVAGEVAEVDRRIESMHHKLASLRV